MSDQPAATTDHEAPTTAATAPITVEQAAAILGVSITTVKRRIRAGSLRAEQAQRPQGTVWMVYLPGAATPGADERPSAASVVATAAATPPAAEAMISLIQTTIGTVLAPLVAEQAALRQTVERQADALRVLERENGRLTAELAAATRPESSPDGPGSTESAGPTTEPPIRLSALWARWWLALAALSACSVVLLVWLLAWWR